jgi:hypothetical protein
MERDKLIELLNSFEVSYPVNEWQIKGVHVWPIIKVKLLIDWNKSSQTKFTSASKMQLLKGSLKGIIKYAEVLMTKKKLHSELYCLAPHFRYNNNGTFINRYFNNLIAETYGQKDFCFFDYGSGSSDYKKNVDYKDKTLFLGDIKYFALTIRELTWRKYKSLKWEGFDSFLSEINTALGSKALTKEKIIRQYAYIEVLKNLYKPILKRNKVSDVYILCYYVSEMYAMNLASSELGIRSHDIQHGGQGNAHVAYANYNVVPASGYKLLPKNFWCWDQASADVIAKWASKSNYHSVEVKGNPWVEYCKIHFHGLEVTNRKMILYTLQPTGKAILDPFILEAIHDTPSDYVWWLRLHPRQLDFKQHLIELLKKNSIYDKVEIEKAIELPLPALLENCHVHISKFSGSILEAHMLRKKTIIISQTGVESFPEVVNSSFGKVVLSEKSNDLLREVVS